MKGKALLLVMVLAAMSMGLTVGADGDLPGRTVTELTLVSPVISEDLRGNVTISVLPDGVLETAAIRTSVDGSGGTKLGPMTFSDPYWTFDLDTTAYENGDLYIRAEGT
ncbi:MAG: hypothetical protein KAH57_00765, partial [Thermoplasmata archaeon]|nr:hypothetical protein [Thermoplasmata archaeon]